MPFSGYNIRGKAPGKCGAGFNTFVTNSRFCANRAKRKIEGLKKGTGTAYGQRSLFCARIDQAGAAPAGIREQAAGTADQDRRGRGA